MTKQRHSIDGFTPRRAGASLGGLHPDKQLPSAKPAALRQLHGAKTAAPRAEGRAGIRRADIDDSLRSIDEPKGGKKSRKRTNADQRAKRKKLIKRALLVLLVLIVCAGAFVGVKALLASGQVFRGNFGDIFQNKPLQQDSNGRSNVLVLGTSDDDEGHGGADLTDSMMLLSVDQNKNDAYLVSIPRDLYVKYGRACNSGYAGKINEYFDCVRESKDIAGTQAALKESATFVGDILGVDIQYGVNLNHTVIRQLVSAVGGITVNIQSRNPNGVMDSNFDWKCGEGDRKVSRSERIKRCPPSGHFIDFPNGEVTMDAEHALFFTMARGDRAPTYGLEESNFDREKNQQLVVKAIQKKATSAGTLSDISKVSALIDAVGNNLRSTFEVAEINTLMKLGNAVKQDKITSLPFNDDAKELQLMTTASVGGASIVQPSAGLYDYSDIRAYLQEHFSNNPVTKEKAAIVVLNGSGVAGAGQKEADMLTEQGFVVTTIANAPDGDYGKMKVYQLAKEDVGATSEKLKQIYGVTISQELSPVAVATGTKFVVVVGQAKQSN